MEGGAVLYLGFKGRGVAKERAVHRSGFRLNIGQCGF